MSATKGWTVAEVKGDWVRLVGAKYGYAMPNPNDHLILNKAVKK